MKKTLYLTGFIKFLLCWIFCLGIRLIPFRPPNIEPLMSTQMPFTRKFGAIWGYAFGFFSIFIFDIISGKLGLWTVITSVVYGLVGVGASIFFKKFKRTRLPFVKYAIIGTLIYDGLTGLTIGPLMFHQSFQEAFLGQIPFTLNHLWGNIILAITVSPVIYKWIVTNENLNSDILLGKFAKQIS